jgi:threonine dehydratase
MSTDFDFRTECEAAARRIAPYIRCTPVEYSPVLSGLSGARVHLKLENLQATGSFKVRGATHALLSAGESATDVVTASSGNHGIAVARAAAETGRHALIFVPDTVADAKLKEIQALDAEIRRIEGDPVEAELAARAHSKRTGVPYISPYNDPYVVAGQGTIGIELASDLASLDVVVTSMGGGGLISGVGGYLKAVRGVTVLACSPANSAVMHESLAAGHVLDLPSLPTLSDGTAGGVEAGAITFDLCREVVDESVAVSEDEIREAMRLIISNHHTLIEGAAGVAVAGFLKTAERWRDRDVAIVLCGANVSPDVLRSVL